MKKILSFQLILLLFLCAPFVSYPHSELRIGVNSDYETLHPALSTTAVARYISYFSYHPLVYLNADNELKPLLIKKIPNTQDGSVKVVVENKIKKLITQWELLENSRWGDGTPITCADIEFAWEIGRNNNISVASRDEYDDIESISWEKKKPKHCKIKYKVTKWDFYLRTPSPLPKHLEESIYKHYSQEKEGYDHNTLYQKSATTKGLWNGPFVPTEIKVGSHIVFSKNENYFAKTPQIDKIIVKIFLSSSVLEAHLLTHNIDMISRIGLDLNQSLALNRKIQKEKLPYQCVYQNGVTYYHIDINLDTPILKDLKVRKALSYGLNKQQIINELFEGKGEVADHYTAKLDRLHSTNEKIKIYESDKRKAKSLLEESGWKLESDNFRHKEGKRLTLRLALDTSSKINETVGTIIQSQWKELGIETLIKPEVARFLFTEVIPKRNFELGMFAWISFPENSQKGILSSSNIPRENNTWTGQNFSGIKNEKLDQLLNDYEIEFDPKKRKNINDEILEIYTQEIPVIPIYFRAENAVIPSDLKNFRLTGHLYFESLNAADWTRK